MYKCIQAGALILAVAFFGTASAGTDYQLASPYYLGVMGTYSDPDDERSFGTADVEEGNGISLLLGKQNPNGWGYEGRAWYQVFETGSSHSSDFYNYGIGADLTYAFGDRTSFTPFVLAGLGVAYNDIDPNTLNDDDYAAFGNVGVGFVTGPVIEVGEMRLRGEARYVYEDYADGFGDIRYSLGVEIPLFKTKTAGADRLDSDRDGIVDGVDRCPQTPPGTRVDHQGCELEDVIVLKGVLFDFDKATLRPEAEQTLQNNLGVLQRYPELVIEIAGHTDSVASDEYNLKLSQGRAETVMKYFVDKGVDAGRMSAKGYGESQPVAVNTTKEGRAQNRRVELRIEN